MPYRLGWKGGGAPYAVAEGICPVHSCQGSALARTAPPWHGQVDRQNRWMRLGAAVSGQIKGGHEGPLVRDAAAANVEAALMTSDEPLTARRLANVAGVKNISEVRRIVRRLQSCYDQDGTAFQIEEIAGGYQLLSRAEYHPWLARLRHSGTHLRLTAAARETLAIVAYRQPIMRADIEGIRGVQCGEMLRQLMEKGLIRMAGRDPSLGRPVLYGTTKKFLQLLGLKSLEELPLAEQLKMPRPLGGVDAAAHETGAEPGGGDA